VSSTQAVTPSESGAGILLVGGYLLTMYLLVTAAYNLHGAFMRPGTFGRRIVRLLVALGAIAAIAFIVTHTVKKGE
jgi:hypothetical protein